MKMDRLKPGALAFVRGLDATGVQRRRLLDIGLVKGTRISVIRRSPLGDPVLYEIRGAMIALRSEEAALIEIGLE